MQQRLNYTKTHSEVFIHFAVTLVTSYFYYSKHAILAWSPSAMSAFQCVCQWTLPDAAAKSMNRVMSIFQHLRHPSRNCHGTNIWPKHLLFGSFLKPLLLSKICQPQGWQQANPTEIGVLLSWILMLLFPISVNFAFFQTARLFEDVSGANDQHINIPTPDLGLQQWLHLLQQLYHFLFDGWQLLFQRFWAPILQQFHLSCQEMTVLLQCLLNKAVAKELGVAVPMT